MKRKVIYKAEDFGVAFNVLARVYMESADSEILLLMNRVCDRYLPYFSIRTLVCAIRDLQPVAALFPTEIPEEDQKGYEILLRRLIRYYISRKAAGKELKGELACILFDLTIVASLTQDKFGEIARFKDVADFSRFVRENKLDESAAFKMVNNDILPIEPDFYEDFAKVCKYMKNYSVGRITHMPSLAEKYTDERAILAEIIKSDPNSGDAKFVLTEDNRPMWEELTERTLETAHIAYKKKNPNADVKRGIAAEIWSSGFQVGYIETIAKDYLGLSDIPDSWKTQLCNVIKSLKN